MIALDTNILIRYLAEPDTAQGKVATRMLERRLGPADPGFVATMTLAEVIWVLEAVYQVQPDRIREYVSMLLELPQLVFEHQDSVSSAVGSTHRDIADIILHEVGRRAGCTSTLTFDKRFARVEGVELAT